MTCSYIQLTAIASSYAHRRVVEGIVYHSLLHGLNLLIHSNTKVSSWDTSLLQWVAAPSSWQQQLLVTFERELQLKFSNTVCNKYYNRTCHSSQKKIETKSVLAQTWLLSLLGILLVKNFYSPVQIICIKKFSFPWLQRYNILY